MRANQDTRMTSSSWLNVSGKDNNCLLHAVAVDMKIDADLAKAFLQIYKINIENASPEKQVALVNGILGKFQNSKDRSEILAYALRQDLKNYCEKHKDAIYSTSLLLATDAIKSWVQSVIKPENNTNLQGYINYYKDTNIFALCKQLRTTLLQQKKNIGSTFRPEDLKTFWSEEGGKILTIAQTWKNTGYKAYVKAITSPGIQLSIHDVRNFFAHKGLGINVKLSSSTNAALLSFTLPTKTKTSITLREQDQHWYREIENIGLLNQLQADHRANPTRKRRIENKSFPAISTLIQQQATALLQKTSTPQDLYLCDEMQKTDGVFNDDTTTDDSNSEKEVFVQLPSRTDDIYSDIHSTEDNPPLTDTSPDTRTDEAQTDDTNSESSEAPAANLSDTKEQPTINDYHSMLQQHGIQLTTNQQQQTYIDERQKYEASSAEHAPLKFTGSKRRETWIQHIVAINVYLDLGKKTGPTTEDETLLHKTLTLAAFHYLSATYADASTLTQKKAALGDLKQDLTSELSKLQDDNQKNEYLSLCKATLFVECDDIVDAQKAWGTITSKVR